VAVVVCKSEHKSFKKDNANLWAKTLREKILKKKKKKPKRMGQCECKERGLKNSEARF
jgi:hypothetical protein